MTTSGTSRKAKLGWTLLAACFCALAGDKAVPIDTSEMLSAHNAARAAVGVPALTYSKSLADSAQAWAEHLKATRNCGMRHSKGDVGENLYWASAWSNGPAQTIAPQAVVDAWVDEKHDYDYASNTCAPGKVCGHYTQVVWKDTRQVGCGMAICDSPQDQIWVCQYSPAGNYVGRKPY
jgi:pathogenesis-related protein 1